MLHDSLDRRSKSGVNEATTCAQHGNTVKVLYHINYSEAKLSPMIINETCDCCHCQASFDSCFGSDLDKLTFGVVCFKFLSEAFGMNVKPSTRRPVLFFFFFFKF